MLQLLTRFAGKLELPCCYAGCSGLRGNAHLCCGPVVLGLRCGLLACLQTVSVHATESDSTVAHHSKAWSAM